MTDHGRQQLGEQLAEARSNATETGRVNQKLRTRQALIEAARQLVWRAPARRWPRWPSMRWSRRRRRTGTSPSADVLIEEVFFDRDFPTVDEVLGTSGDEPTTRVLAVEQAVNDTLLSHESAVRVIVRNAIDMALAGADDVPLRVGRRQKLIAAALEPLERELEPDVLQRLRDALALVIGPEAILAARDVCGLSPEETRQVTRWAAEALVARALSQSDT